VPLHCARGATHAPHGQGTAFARPPPHLCGACFPSSRLPPAFATAHDARPPPPRSHARCSPDAALAPLLKQLRPPAVAASRFCCPCVLPEPTAHMSGPSLSRSKHVEPTAAPLPLPASPGQRLGSRTGLKSGTTDGGWCPGMLLQSLAALAWDTEWLHTSWWGGSTGSSSRGEGLAGVRGRRRRGRPQLRRSTARSCSTRHRGYTKPS
jgi:hypothetical protein